MKQNIIFWKKLSRDFASIEKSVFVCYNDKKYEGEVDNMKYMIASDIHGSAFFARKLLEAFEREGAEKLILLGDILYHGPRNDLPKGYAPKEVIDMLNHIADRILCVRGNCDTEVDQMVLSFPVLADYALFVLNGHSIFATHGHEYNETSLPPITRGDILLCGHTHVPKCVKHEKYTYMNPGSVSIPKEDSPNSYMILEEDGAFLWKDLDSSVYMECRD